MGLRVFEQQFGKTRVKRSQAKRVQRDAATREQLSSILDAVQSVVDVMRDPNTGQRYQVVLDASVGASTNQHTKDIRVTWKPIFDRTIRVSTACTVMTGLVFHEVGHTLFTFPIMDRFREVYGDERQGSKTWDPTTSSYKYGYDRLAFTVLNIADDARLERRQSEKYPVASDVFPTMLHWVAIRTNMVGRRVEWNQTKSKQGLLDRVNFLTYSTRYPWTAVWAKDDVTRTERLWWKAWGESYKVLADDDADGMLALIAEALDRLRNPERTPQPEPPVGPVGPVGPPQPPGPVCGPILPTGKGDDDGPDFGEEDEDEDEPKGKGKGSPADDFEDEDEDGDEPDDDDTDDEPRGGNGGGGDDFDDEDDDELDPDDDDEINTMNPPQGEDNDDDDESDDEDDEPKGEDKAKPGAGDAKPDPDPDHTIVEDFDARDILDVDSINRGNTDSWQDRRIGEILQQTVKDERTIERTSAGRWGSARIKPVTMADFIGKRIEE